MSVHSEQATLKMQDAASSSPRAAPPQHMAACHGRLVDALRAAGKPVE
jgi:hypothetical protein